MRLPFVFPPKNTYPLFFNSFLVFLDLQLLLLFPHDFCPGDDTFCFFVGEGADDGVVVPVAEGSLHFVPRSALLQLPPPPHHGIRALCVAVVVFPRTTRFPLALKNPSGWGALDCKSRYMGWTQKDTRWDSDLSSSPQSLCLPDLPGLCLVQPLLH